MTEHPPFEIVPIKQIDIYTAVRAQLGQLIETGGFSPGDKLPSERSLAASLDVSRMAVREAMKVLEYQGRVQIRQGAGTFVAHPGAEPLAAQLFGNGVVDAAFVNNLAEARGAIECRLVEIATQRATQDDLAMLRSTLDRNEMEHLKDPELGSLNLLFEAAISRVAGNPILASIQRALHEAWVDAWGQLGMAPDSKHRLHDEHLEILEAMAKRDVAGAVAKMSAHVERDVSEIVAAEEDPTNA